MHVGLAADHGGFALKKILIENLNSAGYEVTDFGAQALVTTDDYTAFVVPLAKAVAAGEVNRGLAICGNGVGACIAAKKVRGVRAALITDSFSSQQGVEDNDLYVMCLVGLVTGQALAWDLVKVFLGASFLASGRFKRRLAKAAVLERDEQLAGQE